MNLSFPAFAALLLVVSQARATEPLPNGIAIRVTVIGPVFVDDRGKTLYYREVDDISCPNRPLERLVNRLRNRGVDFLGKVPDAGSRRACTEKFPPVLAAVDATPLGDWSLLNRDDGAKQWAWKGKPLHTSIKDAVPGEVNVRQLGERSDGNYWTVAAAPLDAPPGIGWRLTTLGVVLATHEGKTLYYSGSGAQAARRDKWQPFLAPEAMVSAVRYPDWSIVSKEYGQQWAWKNQPLYVYADDGGDKFPPDTTQWLFVDVFGDPYGQPMAGWHAALLRPAPTYPEQVRVRSRVSRAKNAFRNGYGDRIYTDSLGKPLYVMRCVEGTEDQLDCNDVGDSPRYWLRFCGSEERCMKIWTPLAAAAHARPVDEVWKVVRISPRHPWKPLRPGEEGLAVWAFHGQPVFTYVRDRGDAADYNGLREYEMDTVNPTPLIAFSQR